MLYISPFFQIFIENIENEKIVHFKDYKGERTNRKKLYYLENSPKSVTLNQFSI